MCGAVGTFTYLEGGRRASTARMVLVARAGAGGVIARASNLYAVDWFSMQSYMAQNTD